MGNFFKVGLFLSLSGEPAKKKSSCTADVPNHWCDFLQETALGLEGFPKQSHCGLPPSWRATAGDVEEVTLKVPVTGVNALENLSRGE